jgi:hypothetical protein
MGSLNYSLKRARLQTGLSLLEYPYSLFCSGGTQPHIVMGPPHRKKLLSASKSKGPPEAGFRWCTNLRFNTPVAAVPFEAAQQGLQQVSAARSKGIRTEGSDEAFVVIDFEEGDPWSISSLYR